MRHLDVIKPQSRCIVQFFVKYYKKLGENLCYKMNFMPRKNAIDFCIVLCYNKRHEPIKLNNSISDTFLSVPSLASKAEPVEKREKCVPDGSRLLPCATTAERYNDTSVQSQSQAMRAAT